MLHHPNILEQILRSPGYSLSLELCDEDFLLLRSLIESQYLERISSVYPQLSRQAEKIGMARYHELDKYVDHVRLWSKEHRILGAAAVEAIKEAHLFRRLQEIFGQFRIAEGTYGYNHIQGLEEIYWRLVRPGIPDDVGPLHADTWFHDATHMRGKALSATEFTLKLWIPIYCEPGRSGLLMVPDSHQKDWKHSVYELDGRPRLKFEDEAHPILLDTLPGRIVAFHERTLHGGAVNAGTQTRVSAEITLVFESLARLEGLIDACALT